MALVFHQCVHCQGLVELFGEVVPCIHRTEKQLDIPKDQIKCDCPVQYVYVAPDECSRATCDADWSREEFPFLFDELARCLDNWYEGGE
jgi:hypothetical protein